MVNCDRGAGRPTTQPTQRRPFGFRSSSLAWQNAIVSIITLLLWHSGPHQTCRSIVAGPSSGLYWYVACVWGKGQGRKGQGDELMIIHMVQDKGMNGLPGRAKGRPTTVIWKNFRRRPLCRSHHRPTAVDIRFRSWSVSSIPAFVSPYSSLSYSVSVSVSVSLCHATPVLLRDFLVDLERQKEGEWRRNKHVS